MAATVQLLSRAASTSNTTAAKSNRQPSVEDIGDDFATTLDRAKDTQNNKPQEAAKPKKADDAAPAKKTQAKGKAAKHKDSDKPTDETTETAAASANPAKPKMADAEADAATTDQPLVTEEVTDEPKPVAAKDAPEQMADASTLALAAAVQAQPEAKANKPDAIEATDKPADAVVASRSETATATDAVVAAATDAVAKAATPVADDAITADTVDEHATTDATAHQDTLPLVAALGEDESTTEAQPAITAKKATAAAVSTDTTNDPAAAIAQYFEELSSALDAKPKAEKPTTEAGDVATIEPGLAGKAPVAVATAGKPEQVQTPPEARFADANHPEIVKSVQSQLLPRGGTMQIRLDPPELGAMQVILTLKDGVATASFQTSNDDATRLLSHSLTQLKASLEAAGVTVDKLQVQQMPRETHTNAGEDQHRGQGGQEDFGRQQEQQRKEVIKRMWRKLAGESDPLDLVA